MSFTLFQHTAAFFLRTTLLIVAVSLLLTVEGYSDTVVSPATGGNNLCVGGGYVTLGDITVTEGALDDFKKAENNKAFILQVPSSNFEFKPGTGTVTAQLLSLALTIHSISVTNTQITINYSMANNDLSLDGFVISGIQVRAVNTADNGFIVRKIPTPNEARQKGNDLGDNVNHGLLAGISGPLAPPVLTSSDADNKICPGETITFTASATSANAYEFFVDGVSQQNSTLNTFSINTLTDGQVVTVKAIPVSGCASAASSSAIITVDNLPTISLSSSDGDHTICAGETVTFIASSATATNYEFFVDGVSKQSGASNSYTTSGLTHGQAVKVKASTANGCSSISSDIITTVNTVPTVILTSSDTDNIICAGESVTFTAFSATAIGFEFFVNGISVQNSASNTYTTNSLTNGQTVTVQVKDGNSCSTMSTGITTTVNAVPFLILTSSDLDQAICAGEAVTFKAFSSMPVSGYNFLINGSSVQNTASATFSTTSLSDTDIVTVEAITGAGCNALSNAIAFSVKSLPIVSLTSSNAGNIICAGESVTFTASSATAASYDFFVDGFLVQSGASNQYISGNLANGQTVTVKAASSAGCTSTSSGITMTVNPLPTVTLISDKIIICSGESITFTASSAAATTYEFFVDGISVQNGTSDKYSTTSLANGQIISVKASDGNTCTSVSNSIIAIVNSSPLISLSSSDADNIICMGETVTFTASSATGTYFQFFVDGISVQNGTSGKYSTNSLTNGQVITVRAITSNGCISNSSPGSMVIVNPLPVVNLASSDSDHIICPGESVTFTASSATATSFEFFVDGVSKQVGASNTYANSGLTNGQTITVKATDINGCSTLSSGTTIQVSPLVVILSSSDPNNSICAGEMVTFIASSATATNYEFFVDGVSKQSGASNSYTTSSLTTGQTVTVEATTASGCSAFSGGITTIVNIIPVINLVSSDANNVICAGETVTFMATAPTATNYEFFVDGISVQNSATNLYITSSLTTGQTVTVEATTAGSCTFLHTGIMFTVNPLPSVNITSSDIDNSICSGETVTFTATSVTGVTYEFFVDGISRQNSNSNQYITSTLANGQTVSVKVFDNNGCSIVSSGITTTVNQVPVVLLTSSDADNTICPGESITFTASSATATSFEFFVDGVSKQVGASNTYANSGLTNGQTITVKATTASGCTTSSNGITTFVNILTAVLSSSDADNVICAGDAVTFTANAPTATNYEFFVDGVSIQNSATNLYLTTNLTNGQTITVQATTASGCTDLSLGITTVVNPLPSVSLSSSDADNIICAGEQVIFTANSSTASTYEFFVDNVSVQHTTSNQYITNSLLNGQVVKVKAITAANCFVTSNNITTVVNEIPVVILNSNDADNTICPGESITFTANAPAAVNYEFLVNGISVQSSTSNVYTTNTLTHGHVVSVKVTAASSCSAISSGITISVTTLAVTLLSNDADNVICPGENISFTASSATATSFEFFADGVSIQNGASNTYTTSALTNGQKIHVVARVGVCLVSSNVIPVTVELMTVSLSSSDPDNRICPGTTLTFTASSATATSFEFFADGVSIQNGASNTYTTSALTNGQKISVKALSASSCEATHTGITTYVEDISVVLTSSDSDNVICSGDAVTFTAASASATTYEFFVDGVSIQNGASNTYTTSNLADGQYVFVKVINAYTCSTSSAIISTRVNPLPTVVLTSSDADNVICSGETITFTATSATAVNYKFFVNGSLVQDGAFPTFTTTTLDNGQTVTVRVTTANSCLVESSGITITVNPLPTVVLTSSDADNVICSGETITFTATSATAVNYKFFVNGSLVQDGATNQYSVSSLTNGQIVTVRVTTANSCSVESSGITITVNPLPTVVLTSSDADNVICSGETITFTATSATAVNYKFFVNGSLVQDGAFPTFTTITLDNGQAVTSKVTTADGCSVESSGIITTVNPLPTVSLTSSDADNVICSGETITFTATSATAVNYKFFVNGSLVQDGATNQYSVSSLTNGQIVTVRVTTANSCSVESSGITTTVNPLPTVVLTSSDADNVICSGETITFTATSATATNYEFFIDGLSVQNSGSNKYTTNALTNGQIVFIRVTTADGCSTESSSITITINSLPTVTLASSDADNVICSGETITFTATSATATNYEFFIDGLSVQNSGSNKYTTNALTNGQTVIVRVTTASACSTLSTGISTTVNPVATVNAGTDLVVCANETITLSGSKGGAASMVTWSGGKGIFGNANALSTIYIPDLSEIGKLVVLTLTTNDPDGSGPCLYVEDQVRITINALPNVLFSGLNPEYCIDAPEVTLTGFPVGGFFSGPGIITGTSKFKPSDAGAGTHLIRYTYTDGNNCTNYIEKSVIVHPLPIVSFTGFNNAGPGGSAIYPQDAPLVNLTGSPAGGTFLGQGVSGATFSASAAGAGTYIIRYTYQDANKCMNYQEQTVVVAPLPNVGIGNIPSPFCSKDPDFILTGTPAGGTFSGPGIITNTSIFRPSSAFIGANVIRYTYTDPIIGGTNFIEKTVIVNKVPDVTFSGLNAAYCEDAPNVTLNGFPADNDGPGGVIGIFKGPGIVPGTSIFNPSAAGVGIHTITYIYTNENGCTDSTKNAVIIHALPQVTFSGLATAYCVDAPSVKLTGFPVGGTFNGPGISGASFIPSLAGIGTHLIRYTYTNSNGCVNIQEQSVVINQIPDANFTYFNVCDKDSVSFEDKTLEGLSGKIQQWEWNFGDPLSGSSNMSDLQHPKHLFTAPGEYSVTLSVTSEYGCTDTKIITITVGSIPQPDFTWSDICFGESVDFISQTSLSIGSISSWEWNFGDGTSQVHTNASDKVIHLYPKAGKYTVTLKVTTNFSCTNSISKQIYILPSVATYPYTENFEQSTGGWVEDGINISWKWGSPSGTTINTASSGSKAWYTGSDHGYNPNEKSYVYSPCFDFNQLQKPMISVKLWDHTQKGFDGAVLQYSINGGVDWKNVGAMEEGINWYNQSAIVGNPGNQPIGQNGWSGTDSSWVEAKHDLDFLKGESSVRFRIAFGSNSDNPPGQPLDGFAFDDVYIGERDKIVLLEHFTNSENTEAIEENNLIDGLMDDSGGEIITIQYHTNFSGNDPLNTINPADPSARALYYGVPQTPRTALDGYIEHDKFSQWGIQNLSKRKLAAAAFSIDLNLTQRGPSSLHIAADITSKFEFSDSLFVYAAIVEKEIANAYNGAPVFRNVLRKLLPDAAGMLLSKIWLPGSTETIEFSWEVMHMKDPAQLAVVVFVQDASTKEVYQVVLKEPDFIPEVITGVESTDKQEKIVVYPNPASNQAYISFDKGAIQTGEWCLYDVLGRKVNSGKVQKGQKQVKVETAGLSQGTYLIQVRLKDKQTLYQKLIINPLR